MNSSFSSVAVSSLRGFFLLCAATLSCAQEPATGEVRVVIYQTADLHGRADALPRLARFLKRRRAEDERAGATTVLVDCGDFFQGTPEGDLTRGQLILDAMNLMRYSALGPGNHDFDLGRDTFDALAARARFPFLDGKSFVVGGVEILGGADERLLKRHAWKEPIRVALTHVGIDDDRTLPTAGLIAILGAHSHVRAVEKVGRALLVHTGAQGTHVGRLELRIAGGVSAKAELLEVSGEEDADVRALMRRGRRPEWDAAVGHLDAALTRESSETSSTPLGNFICDAMREFAKAELAIIPRAGARRGIDKGRVTWRELYEAFPFQDELTVARMTGGQIQAIARRVELEISGFKIDGDTTNLERGKTYVVAISSFFDVKGRGAGKVFEALIEMFKRGFAPRAFENRIRRKLAEGGGKR